MENKPIYKVVGAGEYWENDYVPEERQWALVWDDRNLYCRQFTVAQWEPTRNCWVIQNTNGDGTIPRGAYWMELPEPPGTEE